MWKLVGEASASHKRNQSPGLRLSVGRQVQIRKPSTTPLSVCHWWGEARRNLGGEARTSRDTTRRGLHWAWEIGAWASESNSMAVDALNTDFLIFV